LLPITSQSMEIDRAGQSKSRALLTERQVQEPRIDGSLGLVSAEEAEPKCPGS
jgi:hypothetical protein